MQRARSGGPVRLPDGRDWYPLSAEAAWDGKPYSPDGELVQFQTANADPAVLRRAKSAYVAYLFDNSVANRDIKLLRNEIDHAAVQGIWAQRVHGILIEDNRTHHNGATGIQIESLCRRVWLEGNVSFANGTRYTHETGIWLDETADAVVQGNMCSENQKGMLAHPWRKTAPSGFLSRMDVADLQKECDDLWQRRGALLAAHAIPGWFEKSCRERDVKAAPAEPPISVDGALDEPAWSSAPLIEHFIDYRVLRLEGLETNARMLYDDEKLYVAFECFDPSPAEITALLPGPDDHSLRDSVEVLLAPRNGTAEFSHWIVDAAGTVFDARNRAEQDGMARYEIDWDSTAQVASHMGKDRWTVEMAIPAADAGLRLAAGREYRALLCRDIVHARAANEVASNAIVFLDGDGFRTVSKLAQLHLAPTDATPAPAQVEMTLNPLVFGHGLTGDGAGRRIGGDLHIDSDLNLHDFRITAHCTDGIDPVAVQ